MSHDPELRISATPVDLFRAAADEFAKLASVVVETKGRFCVALSGGSTPRGLYAVLASGAFASVPWDEICVFFGDERHVPPDHPDSNYRMAYETLLSKVPISPENVFRIHGEEEDAATAAMAYEQTIQRFFNLQPGEFPRFDLILLGLGPDGHTASLFPGSAALEEKNHLVVANWVEKFKAYRITLTLPVLNQAACIMFLVSGEDKAAIVREVLENSNAGLQSQKVRPEDGRLLWLMDQAAASLLSRPL